MEGTVILHDARYCYIRQNEFPHAHFFFYQMLTAEGRRLKKGSRVSFDVVENDKYPDEKIAVNVNKRYRPGQHPLHERFSRLPRSFQHVMSAATPQ